MPKLSVRIFNKVEINKLYLYNVFNCLFIGSAVGDTTYAVVDTLGIKSGIEVRINF